MDGRAGDGAWDAALTGPDGLLAGSPPPFAARLHDWLAEAVAEDAAAQRAKERWLQTAAEQASTLSGVLLDLAERSAGVTVHTDASRRHHGTIEAIGADFVAVRVATGGEVLLALAAITSVRTAPRIADAMGDRVVTTELRLTDVLAELAAERERVLVVARHGADSAAGALWRVGVDVAVVHTDTDPPARAYVPSASIGEVVLG